MGEFRSLENKIREMRLKQLSEAANDYGHGKMFAHLSDSPDNQKLRMVHSLTAYDRNQATKKNHNVYALGQYLAAADRAHSAMLSGVSPVDAINKTFHGPLARRLHKHLGTGGTDTNRLRKEAVGEEIIEGINPITEEVVEDTEQLDELSPDKLKSYKKKAKLDREQAYSEFDHGKGHPAAMRATKRSAGICAANSKMKEEAGPVEEIEIEEKLTDKTKERIRTALSSPFRKDNSSKPVRALIKLAKTNPQNIKKNEEIEPVEELMTAAPNPLKAKMDAQRTQIQKQKDALKMQLMKQKAAKQMAAEKERGEQQLSKIKEETDEEKIIKMGWSKNKFGKWVHPNYPGYASLKAKYALEDQPDLEKNKQKAIKSGIKNYKESEELDELMLPIRPYRVRNFRAASRLQRLHSTQYNNLLRSGNPRDLRRAQLHRQRAIELKRVMYNAPDNPEKLPR